MKRSINSVYRRSVSTINLLAVAAILTSAGASSTAIAQATKSATGGAVTTAATAADTNLNTLTPAEKAAGWVSLFDGKSADHWRGYKKDSFPEKGWVIEDDGTLHVVAGGGGGDIITRDQYSDFELSLEFKVSKEANSGIMYRSTEQYDAPWMTGPEYQILDDKGWNTAPTDWHSVGACYELYPPVADKIVKPVGEFNTARISIHNNIVTHYLNGMKLLQFDMTSDDYKERIAKSKFSAYEGFGIQPRGHLALQDHGHDVWFRNIKVRDLTRPMPGQVMLFKGKDLDNWTWFSNEKIAKDAVWSADDGLLKCKGKPAGYIKTKDTYDNFVLQLDWRWDPETKQAGNSGVLLRQIGDDNVWPKSVEAQLMSGNAGDFYNIGEFTMSPDPARTEGRRTENLIDGAENPLGEWNHYEIIVDHDNITVYVNNLLVNHVSGVEEIPGHICLQSEGAPIQFRNIRLAPIE